ncbi:lantibiotic immunity ABC transporter MutE/EpiE family permease subunit [Bacillus cytotoxicus]|uniref:Lantibiotic immunity ABC transporter MutE/EpiE family permease subunit n=1 Tax=Bacillus cytotoxicus TaxID=580165 RepID=A0ACC6A3M5_9BACI|nr:lantibiotic immunity ABC transporter MutE/EpiE family permease subunit [Bacillus cytotoxicus]
MNNRAVLSLPISLKRIWISKILLVLGILICSCMIFFCGMQLFGLLINIKGFRMIPAENALLGIFVVIVTVMWQIPICLFLGNKIGVFLTILLSMGANVFLGIQFAITSSWWMNPFTYPSRLMIPIVKILPNGLYAEPGSITFTPELLSYHVLLPGIVISVVLFLFLTYVTAKWFEKQEEK